MAKSLRSKREKRLRAIRREIVEPLYATKEDAKLAAQEAALAAPKLPVRSSNSNSNSKSTSMDEAPSSSTTNVAMDFEMADGAQGKGHLKPSGGVGKKLKKKLKMGRRKGPGKGKIRKKHI